MQPLYSSDGKSFYWRKSKSPWKYFDFKSPSVIFFHPVSSLFYQGWSDKKVKGCVTIGRWTLSVDSLWKTTWSKKGLFLEEEKTKSNLRKWSSKKLRLIRSDSSDGNKNREKEGKLISQKNFHTFPNWFIFRKENGKWNVYLSRLSLKILLQIQPK